jgi:ribonuclease D
MECVSSGRNLTKLVGFERFGWVVSCGVVVTEPAEVGAIAEAIAGASLAAFDLEFLTADRLIPTLCVVQVSWVSEPLDAPVEDFVAAKTEVRVIDALAVDTRPIFEALAAHPTTVVHAARQDLGIVGRFGIAMPNIVDTQVMAAFAGIGDQVGLGALTTELLGLSLQKEQQFTDWARRPLSDAQLAYARADVIHLPAIYRKLSARLGERLTWARAESTEIASDALAAARLVPEDAWRNLGGLRGLEPMAMAVVRELAAWRLRVATELDKPLGWIMPEKLILDLAKGRPSDVDVLKSMKGVPQPARQRADELIDVIAAAQPIVDEVKAVMRAPSARAQRWADLLFSIVQIAAERSGVSGRLLATRGDAEEAARVIDEQGLEAARSLPAFSTWRREVIGALWEGWLTGKLGITGDVASPSGITLA